MHRILFNNIHNCKDIVENIFVEQYPEEEEEEGRIYPPDIV